MLCEILNAVWNAGVNAAKEDVQLHNSEFLCVLLRGTWTNTGSWNPIFPARSLKASSFKLTPLTPAFIVPV